VGGTAWCPSNIPERLRTEYFKSSCIHAFSSSSLDISKLRRKLRRMTPLPRSNDSLGEALHFLRMTGMFYCRSELTSPWALALPPFESCVMFHMVTAGECWLEVEGADPHLLRPGELALVPHGAGHVLSSAPGQPAAAKLFDLPREQVSERYEILRLGGGGAGSSAVCGVVQFEDPAARQLIGLLPRLIVVSAWDGAPQTGWIQSTLQFLGEEAREFRAGGETIITRLADILVIQAIRAWIARDPGAKTGWLGALQDKQIGRALATIHRQSAGPLTLGSLAAGVGMSRSAFAKRFTTLVGEPAMRYVLRWKMQTALNLLKDKQLAVSEVAHRLGFDSESAFSRAFKRTIGKSPGAARRGD
jgi:AraC-like DNA-binding protein